VLERRFKKVVGRSINNEVLRIRLNTAVQLLCETDLAIKVIAMKSGFGSTSYMSAVFREKLNRTPGSYRDAAGAAGDSSVTASAADGV
jgi:LacI family transcriptional regulator